MGNTTGFIEATVSKSPVCDSCNSPIPEGEGYLFISKETANFRRDALSFDAADNKVRKLQQQMFSGTLFITYATPDMLCKKCARREGIDLHVAHEDAETCKRENRVKCRPTPKN